MSLEMFRSHQVAVGVFLSMSVVCDKEYNLSQNTTQYLNSLHVTKHVCCCRWQLKNHAEGEFSASYDYKNF